MSTRRIIRFGAKGELFGVLHSRGAAAVDVGGAGLVICAPFGEEAKSTYRVFFDLAGALADKGWIVLRFDYFGTGNSMGRFDEFTPAHAGDDVLSALDLLREQGVAKLGLLGLGLGAAFAFDAAVKREADFLVMWQPIVNGEEFYKLNVKQAIFRQKLIRSKQKNQPSPNKADAARQSGDSDIIDLDGYPLRKQTAEEIRAINLLKVKPPAIPPTFIMQISFSQTMARNIQALADSCQPKPETQCVICEPFWKRIGSVDTTPVTAATMEWLERTMKR